MTTYTMKEWIENEAKLRSSEQIPPKRLWPQRAKQIPVRLMSKLHMMMRQTMMTATHPDGRSMEISISVNGAAVQLSVDENGERRRYVVETIDLINAAFDTDADLQSELHASDEGGRDD